MRAPTGDDNIGQSLAGALDRAVVQQLMDQQRPDHDLVNLAVAADEFQHVFGSVNFHVGELLEDGQRFDMFLQCLAQSLNSNETFDSNQGFLVDMVLVRMASQGAGRRKNNPSRLCLDCENKKKCIIPIRNKDNLCCARAVVIMRAHCHKQEGRVAHRLYENLHHGYLVQDEEARQLHSLAGVPEGSCGVKELQQFQQALGSQYQLLVMCRSKPFSLIFKGPVAPHQIRLLKSDQHYDGCTSFLPLSTEPITV